MEHAAVLTAYNTQVRQGTSPDGTGAVFETDATVLRRLGQPGHYGSGIMWSDLDAGNADAVIAAQVELFAGRGEKFEWKLYSYDQPADLAERLLAAGFVAEDAEALMVAEVWKVGQASRLADLPAGIVLEQVTDAEGVARLTEVHERVFGKDESELRALLLAQLSTAPEITGMVLAMAGGEAVCAARIEFVPGADFAGLWGGGTLPAWRGRGIYRALVGYRAALAAERGYRYLQVDASPASRPILERIGFTCLAMTTPYIWHPGSG